MSTQAGAEHKVPAPPDTEDGVRGGRRGVIQHAQTMHSQLPVFSFENVTEGSWRALKVPGDTVVSQQQQRDAADDLTGGTLRIPEGADAPAGLGGSVIAWRLRRVSSGGAWLEIVPMFYRDHVNARTSRGARRHPDTSETSEVDATATFTGVGIRIMMPPGTQIPSHGAVDMFVNAGALVVCVGSTGGILRRVWLGNPHADNHTHT